MTARDWRNGFGAALFVALTTAVFYWIDPHFFFKDDFQLQFLPASREVARAWLNGEIPLLTRSSWFSSALAAEYQFGVFSLFRALCDVVVWSLPMTLAARAATLFIAHGAVCACGAYLLARSYGVRATLAVMVALIASMNGWLLWWGTTWFVAIAAFAWLPWYWFALRAVALGRSRWSWAGAAFALYLLIAAGSPYVVGMAILVVVMHLATELLAGRSRAAWSIAAASALGVLLAAPAILAFLEYFPETARSSMVGRVESVWVVPALALFGFVLPAIAVKWPTFAGPLPHHAVELLGAFVPLAAIGAALLSKSRREFLRRNAGELVVLVAGLLLILLPAPAPFRWSFHWLPLVHLTLAILGAVALERGVSVWKCGLVMLAISALVAATVGSFVTIAILHAAILAALCVVWAILERRNLSSAIPAAVTLVLVFVTFGAFRSQREVPVWSFSGSLMSPAPFETSRRYLAMYGLESVVAPDAAGRFSRGINVVLRPGNTSMLSGLRFVNGYSPMAPEALETLFHLEPHGAMQAEDAGPLLRFETGRGQLLDHAGVDGLIVPANLAASELPSLTKNGWRVAARSGSFVVLHRIGRTADPVFLAARGVRTPSAERGYAAIFERRSFQLPVVLFTPGMSGVERYGPRVLESISEKRSSTSVIVRAGGPKALLVFRRPWLPGWRATIDGSPLPVLRADMIMPAVEIPAGAGGEVRLVYRPASLIVGGALAALGLLGILLTVVRGWSVIQPSERDRPTG